MSDEKRVYRATACYDDRPDKVRHFLTKRSRDAWAKQRLEGYPSRPSYGYEDDGHDAIPPATCVYVADSDPIVFTSVERAE